MESRGDIGWQDDKSALECFLYMLENEIATDVCFEVGPPDGRKVHVIRAHKFVLVSRSSVFEAMLCGSMAESRNDRDVIKIPDVNVKTFQEMLKYMYADSSDTTASTALPLMYAAKKYMLTGLVNECQKALEEELNVEDVCDMLEQSRLLDEEELMKKCLSFIDENSFDVLKSEGFFRLSRDSVEKIIESDHIMVESEAMVFKVCTDWAKRKLQTELNNQNPTDEEIREVLGNVLFKIRFPTMSAAEFADTVGKSGILTSEEQKDIYFYLITKQNPERLQFDCREREFAMIQQGVIPVSRFKTLGNRWNCEGLMDAIGFHTDTNMKLIAVGLYGGLKPATHDVTIEVSTRDEVLSRVTTQMKSNGSQTPVKVSLTKIVKVAADTRYTVAVTVQGPLTFNGDCGVSIPIACGTAKVTFLESARSTNGTHVEKGQIPQLFFAL